MKKNKNLRLMDGKELLTLYRRKIGLATKNQLDFIAPRNNKHLKEISKIRKELVKRLGTFSVLTLSDECGGTKVIGPFFNEKEEALWLTEFWGGFRDKFGADKTKDLWVDHQKINIHWLPIHPSGLLKILRLSGSRVVL